MTPQIAFRCPSCDAAVAAPLGAGACDAACPSCAAVTHMKEGALDASARLVRCAVCGMEDFWLKKNFRSEYGCLILVVAAAFMNATYQLSLPAAVLLDFVLYQFLGDVAVCYRCKAEVRHVARNPAHKAYDLHHATHLDKEIYKAGGARAFIAWDAAAGAQAPQVEPSSRS